MRPYITPLPLLLIVACGGAEPLLFDLTPEELLEIQQTYDLPYDEATLFSRVEAPFDCSVYGDLCAMIGSDAAQRVARVEWDLARAGASLEAIDQGIADAIRAEVTAPEPDVPEADTESQEGFGTSTSALLGGYFGTKKIYLSSSSTRRGKVVFGTVNPLIGKAHCKVEITAQEKRGIAWYKTPVYKLIVSGRCHEEVVYTYFSPPSSSTMTRLNQSGARRNFGVDNLEIRFDYTAPGFFGGGWGLHEVRDPFTDELMSTAEIYLVLNSLRVTYQDTSSSTRITFFQ